MRYKVIGWTFQDDRFPPRAPLSNARRNAVIDEIRKHKYEFTGEEHQERSFGAPILNDGTKLELSRRGWGALMAEAWGHTDPFDYASYTDYICDFDDEEEEDPRNLPSRGFQESDFQKRTNLRENIAITTKDKEQFRAFRMGEPIKILDSSCESEDWESLRRLDKGDRLTLRFGEESYTRMVSDVGCDKDLTEEEIYRIHRLFYCGDPKKSAEAERRWRETPIKLTILFRGHPSDQKEE